MEERGDNVSMSDVVIRSTENGPNLVIVDGKVVQAWCRPANPLVPFCDEHTRKTDSHQNTRSKIRQRNGAKF
jgi:hypothetical protein